MTQLFDDNVDNLSLVEGVLLLNSTVDLNVDKDWVNAQLQIMCQEVDQVVHRQLDDEKRLACLLELFYVQWGYHGDIYSAFKLKNTFIDHVLKTKEGIPVTLGALFLYLCQYCSLPVTAINFPTQLLLKIALPNQKVKYLNPFDGEYVSECLMNAWLVGHLGPLAKMEPAYLKEADNSTLIGRLLGIIKAGCIREHKLTRALRCSDLALSLVPDDPFEIRDRGLIYQQLECHHVAKSDLEFFIKQCPDDPSALLMKEQVLLLDNIPMTLH